ncbi:MAG TPA: ArsC/Spx/MgsR family protein [Actinomycetota bacterium]
MTPSEIKQLGHRAGGVRELVAPRRRAEVEGMSDRQVVAYLAQDPARLRRPIIDTGGRIHLGFSKAVREALG